MMWLVIAVAAAAFAAGFTVATVYWGRNSAGDI